MSIVTMDSTAFGFVLLLSTATYAQVQNFTSEPQSAIVNGGERVVLACVVENLSGSVQWLRDGFGLGPGPTFDGFPRYAVDADPRTGRNNLVISNVQAEDDAKFQCQVSASETSPGIQSNEAQLTVQIIPQSVTVVGASFQTLQVVANVTTELLCVVVGARPAARISWDSASAAGNQHQLAMTPLQSSMETDGKLSNTTGMLSIRPSPDDNGATVRCLATNDATGLLSPVVASVQISVVFVPEVTILATPSGNVKEFDQVVFTCFASANPSTINWQWYVGDELQLNERGNSLVVARISREFATKPVSCVATNTVGSTRSAPITVPMTYGPKFVVSPADEAADLGATSATLFCVVDSNPTASVVWTRRDAVLSHSSQLTISPVTEDSFGTYRCTATVPGFAPVSVNVQLRVNGPATFVSSPVQYGSVGGTAYLDCVVSSASKLDSVTWTRDGLNLTAQPRYSIRQDDTKSALQTSLLTITDTVDSDFGVFNCTASNSHGSVTLAILFSKREQLQVSYVIAGVLAALVVIAIIVAVVFVCRRHRTSGSELGSDSSESQMTKHVVVSVTDNEMDSSHDKYLNTSHSPGSEPSSGCYSVRSMSRFYESQESWGIPIDRAPVFSTLTRGSNSVRVTDPYAYSNRPPAVSIYRDEIDDHSLVPRANSSPWASDRSDRVARGSIGSPDVNLKRPARFMTNV